MSEDDQVSGRWDGLRGRVRDAAHRAGRDADSVAIMAVTKMQSRTVVDRALAGGVVLLGENRVQEARDKFSDPPLPSGVSLHLIGQLQSNKVRQALKLFDVVESVDRQSLIEALAREAAKSNRVLPIMIQVNVAGEQQKAGCEPEMVPALVQAVEDAGNLRPRGLMTIAPLVDDPEVVRPVFRELRRIRDGLLGRYSSLDLSMGMSNDLDVAIAEGATIVRAGRALFGERG